MPKKQIGFIAVAALALSLFFGNIYAADDGFIAAGKIVAKNFTLFYESGVDVAALPRQLNLSPAERMIEGRGAAGSLSAENNLSDMLDTLFVRISDILDMHLYSFTGTIKVCKDQSRLSNIYSALYDSDLKGRYSFYAYEPNTVYISAQNFTTAVLGHEMAHAIISHYFVVLPSVKIQEILSGYVEYQLRK